MGDSTRRLRREHSVSALEKQLREANDAIDVAEAATGEVLRQLETAERRVAELEAALQMMYRLAGEPEEGAMYRLMQDTLALKPSAQGSKDG